MKSTYTGRIRVIAVALSCFFSLTISLLSPLGAKARDLEEILDSGYLAASLRDRDTVWHPTGPKQLQERIVEIFAENLSRKFKKAIKLKKIIVPDFSTLWKDKSGEVVHETEVFHQHIERHQREDRWNHYEYDDH